MFVAGTRQAFHLLRLPFLLTLILVSRAGAQDAATGALRGMVLDAQGAAVTRADVVAIRVDTGIRYHSATDAEGRFVLDLLPPGEYSARAEAEGMLPQGSPRVLVEVGAAVELTFKLAVAGAKETVTVSDGPQLVETQPSAISAMIDERVIADLPLSSRRHTDLSLLAPGVTQDPRGISHQRYLHFCAELRDPESAAGKSEYREGDGRLVCSGYVVSVCAWTEPDRARDVNLPPPAEYSYPIYDPTGTNFTNSFYPVDSFGTW